MSINGIEKRFARTVCRIIYGFGLGDCWYEPTRRSTLAKGLYALWAFASNFYLVCVLISELAAFFRPDLTFKEVNDNVQLTLGHCTVLFKFISFHIQKDNIRKCLEILLEHTPNRFTVQLEAQAVRRTKMYIATMMAAVYVCIFFSTLDGIAMYYKEGIPPRTMVTYWPTKEDSGLAVNIIRVLVQFSWWYMVSGMMSVDSLCLIAFMYLRFRYKALKSHYESLREAFETNPERKTREALEKDMESGLVRGIQLHIGVVGCSKGLQEALANIYSVQVVQSIGLLSMCLIKFAFLERSFSFVVANVAFVYVTIILTSVYMLAAGDVTHEAADLPNAVFACGWELCRLRPRRALLQLALQRGHAPVVMTAFGVFDLSYGNVIWVVRTSYSFFAVVY